MAAVNDVEEDETRITLNDQGGPEDLSGRADDDSRHHSSNLWKRTRTEALPGL